MPIKNLWFNYRLECIKVFLTRAFQVRDKYAAAVASHEDTDDFDEYPETLEDLERARDIFLGYYEIVLRALYAELNALVERELKYLATSLLRAKGEKPRNFSRGTAYKTIERECGIRLEDLPRFREVDEVREIINAYKHEDGFSGEYAEAFSDFGWLFGCWGTRYRLDWDKAYESIQAVKEFLTALPGEREQLPERRSKPEDEATIQKRAQAWATLRKSGALGHQLGVSVVVTGESGGYSATCELCGKSFWAESEEILYVLAVVDSDKCPGVSEVR